MFKKAAIAVVASLCAYAHAQNLTQITATNTTDAGGSLLAQGEYTFTPTDGHGNLQAFRFPGGGQGATTGVVCLVVDGAITTTSTGKACQLANTGLTNPQNLCYQMAITDSNNSGALVRPIDNCVQPSGSTYSLDQFIPNNTTLPIQTLTGGSVSVPYGTTAGTAAAGNDSRIVNAVQSQVGNAGADVPSTDYNTISRPQLANFLLALHSSATAPVRILVVGDSRSILDTTIASPTTGIQMTFGHKWPDLLRSYLQSAYGSHGTGMVPLIFAAASPRATSVNGDFWGESAAVGQDCALGPQQAGGIPYCGVAVISSGQSVTFTGGGIAYDHFRAYCETQAASGTMTMTLDGSTNIGTACGTTTSTPTAAVAYSAAFALGSHTVQVSCSGGPCYLYAGEGVAGTSGVSIDNVSIASSALGTFGANPAVNEVFSDLIPEGHQLTIVYQLTNEPGVGETTTQYQTELGNLIAHERALSSAPSIELVSPGQDIIAGQAPFFPVLAAAAKTYGTAYVDIKNRWGSALNPAYFGTDQAHENNAGHLEEFAMISQPLIDTPPVISGGGSLDPTQPITVSGITIPSAPGSAAPVSVVNFSPSGGTASGLGCWGGGANGAGITGTCGWVHNNYFPWVVDAAGDIFFGVPVSGGNVAAGVGAKAAIMASGAVTGFGAGTYGVPTVSPSYTSTTTIPSADRAATDHEFTIVVTTTGSTAANTVLTQILLGKHFYKADGTTLIYPHCNVSPSLVTGNALEYSNTYYGADKASTSAPQTLSIYVNANGLAAGEYIWEATCDGPVEN